MGDVIFAHIGQAWATGIGRMLKVTRQTAPGGTKFDLYDYLVLNDAMDLIVVRERNGTDRAIRLSAVFAICMTVGLSSATASCCACKMCDYSSLKVHR